MPLIPSNLISSQGGFITRALRTVAVCIWLLTAISGCAALTGETLGQNIDDTNITAAVKAKLAAEKASTLTRIDVDTVRGVVHLGGVVANDAERARAEQISSQVGGVKRVINDLQVQKR
jgi:hyperosmotically inducible periplasmic protein